MADLTAVIVWRRDGERVPPDLVTTNRTHAILRIRRLARSDSGTYNCSASNRYGRDSIEANLTVLGVYNSYMSYYTGNIAF